jgi:HAD superfamily hydrolase (TIGR01450 family)
VARARGGGRGADTQPGGGLKPLDDVRGFVLDIDGTLVHRAGQEVHVQPGALEVLERIRASGRRFVLFTNGSHEAPESFAAGLRAVGLPVGDEDVLTPLCSVQFFLRRRRAGAGVYVFAGETPREYLARSGVRLVDSGDDADVVFVAHADAVDFDRLEQAARAVIRGAKLLTASYQPAYAGANGPILSRGAMTAAAIAKASSTRPTVVGKPSRAALAAIADRLGAPPSEIAVIGDDVNMDIALGRLGGARTVLVRSGISGALDLARIPERRRPDEIVEGVAELVDRL